MPRLKKKGLAYFPCDTAFFQSRPVRRVMKATHDSAGAVLMQVLCNIYGGEGYFVVADEDYFDDLADYCYNFSPDFLRQVVDAALEQDIFDRDLFLRHGILTSAEIQRQYLLCLKQKDCRCIDPRYNLVDAPAEDASADGDAAGETAADVPAEDAAAEGVSTENPAAEETAATGDGSAGNTAGAPAPEGGVLAGKTPEIGTEGTKNNVFGPKTPDFCTSGTQNKKKEKQNKEEENKENLLLRGSPETGETGGTVRGPAEEGREDVFVRAPGATVLRTPRVWTMNDVRSLRPPADGLPRNLDGLLLNLSLYRVPPQEQYAIVLKSNFGAIGHPVWQGFEPLRTSHGKIRSPGKFLLSLCNRK